MEIQFNIVSSQNVSLKRAHKLEMFPWKKTNKLSLGQDLHCNTAGSHVRSTWLEWGPYHRQHIWRISCGTAFCRGLAFEKHCTEIGWSIDCYQTIVYCWRPWNISTFINWLHSIHQLAFICHFDYTTFSPPPSEVRNKWNWQCVYLSAAMTASAGYTLTCWLIITIFKEKKIQFFTLFVLVPCMLGT